MTDPTDSNDPTKSPDVAALVDWLDGRLNESDSAQVSLALENAGQATQALVTWLRALKQAGRIAPLATPPTRAHNLAIRAFAERKSALHPNPVQRLVATLVQRPQPRLSALRSAGARLGTNRLTYSAGGVDVILDFRARRQDGAFDLDGQVFVNDVAEATEAAEASPGTLDGIVVLLLQDQVEYTFSKTNEFGEFSFAAVPPGSYTMLVITGTVDIEIPALLFSAAP